MINKEYIKKLNQELGKTYIPDNTSNDLIWDKIFNSGEYNFISHRNLIIISRDWTKE